MILPVKEVKIKNRRYSLPLSKIYNPPKLLYCRGNLDLLKSKCLGVVGTRKLTSYGKEAAETIVRGLSLSSFTIVSGLALGIDSVAHSAALDAGLKTIAVLGSGVNDSSIYPQTNLNLAKKILQNDGLIVSEYKPGEMGFKGNFPARNRIISGLSVGVLVVEADEKSGSLITANWAVEQNRDVFAVPGSIFSPKSTGPNRLIKCGAKPVLCAQDILEEYGQESNCHGRNQNDLHAAMNETEKNILGILTIHGPSSADFITQELQKDISEIAAAISIMEINGIVKNQGDGKYRLAK